MTDLSGGFPVDASLAANFRLLQDVDVKLTVEIGSTSLTLRELLALGESSVIELDRQANELLDVLVELDRHPTHLRFGQRVDAELLDELVHAAGGDAGEVAVRHDGDER